MCPTVMSKSLQKLMFVHNYKKVSKRLQPLWAQIHSLHYKVLKTSRNVFWGSRSVLFWWFQQIWMVIWVAKTSYDHSACKKIVKHFNQLDDQTEYRLPVLPSCCSTTRGCRCWREVSGFRALFLVDSLQKTSQLFRNQ